MVTGKPGGIGRTQGDAHPSCRAAPHFWAAAPFKEPEPDSSGRCGAKAAAYAGHYIQKPP